MQDAYEIVLPKTGAVVTIKGFLTTGQSRELQRVLLADKEFDALGTGEKKVSPDSALDMQDKAAELLITQIKHSDGATAVFTKEWLYDLPIVDGNLVYEQINKVVGEATLSEESKKK